MSCDLISEIASLTGWDINAILNLPLHQAMYYHLKATNRRGCLSEWVE